MVPADDPRAGASERDAAAVARDNDAVQRDEAAGERDTDAQDHSQALLDRLWSERNRDSAAEESERRHSPENEDVAISREVARSQAEVGRKREYDLLDRGRADRKASAADRAASRHDRDAAAQDRVAARDDRVAAATERECAEAERQQAEITANQTSRR